jgi:DNA invertase Pin-like site-specific DNA recombinase
MFHPVFEIDPRRVWLQLRKSRHLGDPDDPRLLATHRAILLRLAAEDGLTIAEAQIIAEQESGEFLAQRPEFSAALAAWEALPPGTGGVLYTMALDRLSRGEELERARVQTALRRAGILIRTPSGVIDLQDPDQRLLAGFKGELAAHELARFKWRVAQTHREKLLQGHVPTGEVPFGYRWSKDEERPIPDGDRFAILKACCREVFTTSLMRLARRYHIPPAVLQKAMHSPVICGWAARRYTVGLSTTGRRQSVLLPPDRWIWAEKPGNWEAACSRVEWHAIQSVLLRRSSRREWTGAEDGWCRSVLRLEGAHPAAWIRLQAKGERLLYTCVVPETHAPCGFIVRSIANAAVEAHLAAALQNPAALAAALLATPSSPADPAPLRAALEERRAQLKLAVRSGLAAPDEETRAAHFSVQRDLEAEIRALKRDLQALEYTAAPAGLAPLVAELAPLLSDFAADWAPLPAALKRQIVDAFLETVWFVNEPVPGRVRLARRVTTIVWQEWVRPFLEH